MSTTANKVTNPMKVITGPDTRWSYANVWEPKSINGGTPKYSVSLIIPKSDTKTVAKIKAAIEAAYQEGQAKLKGNGRTVPPLAAIKTPLRDGDIERPDDPAYANAYFINANSPTAPGIVDADRNPVLTRSEVYSGVYGRASINLYAFNSNGNKGDFGGSEDYSSDGTQYVISSDGHAVEQDYADTVRLEDLIDKLKIQLPEHGFSHPNESTILEELRKNIRGQPMATATIAHLVHAHLCKKDPQRPLSFLLHGQPGTGKTESAKALAKILERYCEPGYGYSMTQLNTFTKSHTISRLLGAEPGYVGYEEKGVFETVVDNPYMVYCFDEIEKAHPVILKAFMSILDDGVLASRKELDDGSREFNFKHCIFVFTSNLKLNNPTPKIGFCTDAEIKDISTSKKGVAVSYEAKPKAVDPELVQEIYSNNEKARAAFVRTGVLAEIASRFGCFVEFQPLSEDAKLEILAKTVLHIGFEYGVKLSKIDNAIMQELVNSVSAENGLTVRSFRTVIEGYLASAFAATSGLSGGDSGTYRLGGTLANPVLKQA